MPNDHPLDRPVWNALSGPLRHLSLGDDLARRLAPDYGLFAAAADDSDASQAALAALCLAQGSIGLVELDEKAAPPGLVVVDRGACWQMVAENLTGGRDEPAHEVMGESDAPDMRALADLTKPGPFFERTHQLGRFIGVKANGQLAAMAGERMRVAGFTEVSGVCTHPDHRGHGHAAGLTRAVAAGIAARGETPFLHVYESNAAAIAIYQALGFALRRRVVLTVLARA